MSLTVSRSDGSHGEASVSYRIAYGSADAKRRGALTGNPALGRRAERAPDHQHPGEERHPARGDETFTLELFDRAARSWGSAPDPGDHRDKLAPSTIPGSPHHDGERGQWFAEIPWCAAAIQQAGPCRVEP